MQALFKVTYHYKSYNEKNGPIKKERELFLDKETKYVNTNRLSGFERATISNVKTEYIRDKEPIEIDIDIERNEIEASIDAMAWLENVLQKDEKLTDLFDDEDDLYEHLESLGFEEKSHDNTYNYDNELDETFDYKIYDLPDSSDYIYSDTAIVIIRKHIGLDVRAGYEYLGAYKANEYDGLVYFFDQGVRISIADRLGNEVEEFESVHDLTNDYKVTGIDGQTVLLEKEGNKFFASFYSPVYGI